MEGVDSWVTGRILGARHHDYCITLPTIAAFCNILHCTATHCNTLLHTATYCNILQDTATHFNTLIFVGFWVHAVFTNLLLQHTATHCNTLQHTATHCNTLQHTATNLLLHSWRKAHPCRAPKWNLRTEPLFCSVLQFAVCCSVLQGIAVCCSVLHGTVCCSISEELEHDAPMCGTEGGEQERACACVCARTHVYTCIFGINLWCE